jgi:hypothetical protein
MKKLAVLAVFGAILFSGIAYGASAGDFWIGTWDVKQPDGDAVWNIPGPAVVSGPPVTFKITGTTTYGGKERFMQIIQVSFFAGKYIYTEDEQLGNDMGKQEVNPVENDKGVICSFDTEGITYDDYGLISGTKRGAECEDAPTTTTTVPDNGTECIDQDGDGYGEGCSKGTDCDDNNTAINPGAEEVCGDDIDQNCDGEDELCPPECTITLDKDMVKAGAFLPRLLVLTITGSGDDFDPAGAVTFSESGIIKITQSAGSGSIRVIGLVLPAAKGKTVTVSVAGCDGTADLTVE